MEGNLAFLSSFTFSNNLKQSQEYNMLHKSSTFSIDNGSLSPCAIIRFIYSDEL